MILPIVAFGAPILRKKCVDITPEYPELETLLANMWETMYEASGVGLAAPQINKAIRLFLIDTTPFVEDEEETEEVIVKQTFIEYFDENFQKHTDTYDGLTARVIQHEYDHVDGILFTDKISALRKRMIKGRLMDISKGKVNAAYKMRFTR